MAGIEELLNLDSGVGAQFLASVLGALVQAVLGPEFDALNHLVNAQVQNAILSPEMLADLVERGHMDQDAAAQEAAQSGLGPGRFDRLVKNAGNPPGPGELAEALRRGIIPEDAGTDTAPSFWNGIKQSRLQTQWGDTIRRLDERLPGPETAVDAEVRNMLSGSEARIAFKLFGGNLDQYQLLYNLAGEGPTPVEAGILANRRIIDWDGTGADRTTFQQAVAESRFKNKWEAAYRALAQYRPPPRTITAMLREGSIDEPTATQMLKDYGVPDQALGSYLLKTVNAGVQKAHELTEAEVIKLYTERGLSHDDTTNYLQKLGYSPSDADLIIAGADLDYESKLSTATIAAVKALYLHRHIEKNDVITTLDRVGVKSDYRDALLQLWDLEIMAGVKSLTVKQIMDMTAVGLLTAEQGLTKLKQAGYSDEDAGLLMAFSNPDIVAQAAQNGSLFDPGSTG